MNVPLDWLKDYVTLPKTTTELTDRLTMVGHMLDKEKTIAGQTVLDLELRGNRSDLFGLIGIARDVAASFDQQLHLPDVCDLPKISGNKKPKKSFITVDAPELVERFLGLTLTVTVKPSPEFIVKRLEAYGIPSINNIVDITNYCMIEIGEPMHAYDREQLSGGRLIIRKAKPGESLTTLLGTKVQLQPSDLVIADDKNPQGLTMIGGDPTRVTEKTQEILLEAAVYNQGNVRRTARRLAITTEAGSRHEKNLDPNQVEFALQRAYFLLKKYADAKPSGELVDYYPHPFPPTVIEFDPKEVTRLTALSVPVDEQIDILTSLECQVKEKTDTKTGLGSTLMVTIPSFRNDLIQSADLVEEIARIVGYEWIPETTLSGVIPPDYTPSSVRLDDELKAALVHLQLNEVITSSFIAQKMLPLYSQQGTYKGTIELENPPDQGIATLQPSLLMNLVDYAVRSFESRAKRIAIFEIGNVYSQHKDKYIESRRLGILFSGTIDTKSYDHQPRAVEYADLKGSLEMLARQMGWNLSIEETSKLHPSLQNNFQAELVINGEVIGIIGALDSTIQQQQSIKQPMYYAELNLQPLETLERQTAVPYQITPPYPPAFEDFSISIKPETKLGVVLDELKECHPLVSEIELIDTFEIKRTIRVTYLDRTQNLTTEIIKPARQAIVSLLQKQHLL